MHGRSWGEGVSTPRDGRQARRAGKMPVAGKMPTLQARRLLSDRRRYGGPL